MGRIIATVMNKGGVGKTSFITNVSGVLASKGKRVLIVDTDAQGNASISFGLNPDEFETTTYDVMVGNVEAKDAVINVCENIDMIVANTDLSYLVFDVLQAQKTFPNPFNLLESLNDLRDNYDYILIDAPPSLELVASNIFSIADEIVIPFVPEAFAVKGLINVIKTINDFKVNVNEKLIINGVVAMMINSRTRIHKEILQQAKDYCDSNDLTLYENYIPASIRFSNAQAYDGKPATMVDFKNDVVQSYFELVDEMGL